MGSCTRRHFLLSICFLQLTTIIERQVFDFLGYMWAPILVNFFHIIFVIFGFYGAYHFRVKYIITYLIWNFFWIGWNSFLICFYLNVGVLDRDSDLLNLGTGSVSWFEVNGYGCKPTFPENITSEDPFRPIRPERVDDCLLDYTLVEVIHSGVQCAFALLGILGAILISYIFLDEDDRFDFMNGDAKSPQHTVVHPMYVSYSSIPTSASASATLLSNKHHSQHHQHHQQQAFNSPPHQQPNNNNNYNNNTFLIHSTNTNNSSHSISTGKNVSRSGNGGISGNTPNASKNNTLTRMLYSPNNKIASSTTSIMPTTVITEECAHEIAQQQLKQQHAGHQQQQYYDDSTAKADHQLYAHNGSTRRQQQMLQQQQHAGTPCSSHDNTTSSLSYASLQNSNLNLTNSSLQGGHAGLYMREDSFGGGGNPGGGSMASPLSNSNYSLSNSINNNNNSTNPVGGGHFARIHSKPKPPKSTSYSSFINGGGGGGGVVGSNGANRPDIKYTQMSSERLSGPCEEGFEDDNFSLRNFKADDSVTYVPFQKPTPGNLFVGQNNNPSYTSLNSYRLSPNNNASPNNNGAHSHLTRDNSQVFRLQQQQQEILLEHGAVLQPASPQELYPPHPQTPTSQREQPLALSAANRFMYQQNGLPFHPAYSPTAYRAHPPTRPTNIPLPTIPVHTFEVPLSPSEVTPPPPPAPRPHIFQPRSGHAPYPDLSPDVTEKYAMPTQYVPRSPIASRIARRQRQQPSSAAQLHQVVNSSANFCDQIRNAPPGYIDPRTQIVRAKSHDRLSSSHDRAGSLRGPGGGTAAGNELSRGDSVRKESAAAPHVNRRSGRREGKARPRSYCNSMAGGEGVIRGSIIYESGGAAGVPKTNGGVVGANEYIT